MTLFNYQLYGIGRLVLRGKELGGVILADMMGLGKIIQLIGLIMENWMAGPNISSINE